MTVGNFEKAISYMTDLAGTSTYNFGGFGGLTEVQVKGIIKAIK